MSKNLTILIIVALVLAIVGFLIFASSKSQPKTTHQETKYQESKTIPGYSGKVLAGENSPYLEFNRADYDKAQASGKIIFLDFYANWCPICRAEAPILKSGFDNLTSEKIIAFRVNFNDSDTDADEKALAKQFNVPYQHTKIILKGGKGIDRSTDQWNKETFDKEINKLLQSN